MAGRTLWDNLSRELSNADDNQFRKKIISLLRIFNRSFKICSDIPGVDFIVSDENKSFIWVVQCQTFNTELPLVEEHAHKIGAIAQAFLNEGFRCDKYWILHNHQHGNRGGKFTEFLEALEEHRRNLEDYEKIREVSILQRQEFIQKAEKEYRSLLVSLLQAYSDRYRLDIESRLEFGKYYISEVPTEEYDITIREYEPYPNIRHVSSGSYNEASSLIISEGKNIRWTLMHGEAGAGKTTTALHAANVKNKIVFFVNCDVLDFYSLHSGTNFLFEYIFRSLNILDQEFVDETDRELFYSLSGATLSPILSCSEEHILIFDGLDENRFYSDPKNQGLKLLSDRLSDIHCPILLVTRTSHFEESLYGELVTLSGSRGSSKARRKARALKLVNWNKEHVTQLINNILEDFVQGKNFLDEKSSLRIQKFRDLFINEDYKDFYGDLPLNPLFLQFILSDVIERDIQKANRPMLVYQWVRKKIYRDFEKENRSFLIDRNLPSDVLLNVVDKLLYVMELTSKDMVLESSDGSYEMQEFTNSQVVEEITKRIFQVEEINIIDLFLNSVLTSHATLTRERYRSTKQRVTFAFKIFQEYFLACSIVRHNGDFSKYPKSVIQFCKEILKTNSEEELWLYLRKDFKDIHARISSNSNSDIKSEENLLNSQLKIIIEEIKKVSEEPKRFINTHNYFEKGTHTHNHNYSTNKILKQQIAELRELTTQLQQTHQPSTEAEAIEIIDVEFREIQKTNPSRWQNIRNQLQLLKNQLLNPERHLTASKATIVEIAKHYLEESVVSKALITYLDTMSADTDEGE
jgi:hypothetical protein